MNATATCRDCSDDLDHCHDTLIVHVDGRVECGEAGCHAVVVRHSLVIPCADLGRGCACDADR